MKKNEILDQSFDFALKIIELAKFLKNKKEYVISNQILRSGTSVGASVTEAQAAQSTKDFIAKLSIASKESRETNYWLRLLDKSGYLGDYPNQKILFDQSESIIKLLTTIIKSTKGKIKNWKSLIKNPLNAV